MRGWWSEPKFFNYPVCWHYFICITDIKFVQHSISVTELGAASANAGLCPSAGCGQCSAFQSTPPSLRLLKFQSFLWHRKLSVCGMSILQESPWTVYPNSASPNSSWPFVVRFWHAPIIGESWVWREHFIVFLLLTSTQFHRFLSLTSMEKEGKVWLVFFFSSSSSFMYKFNFPCYILNFSGQSDASLISVWFSGLWPFHLTSW